MTRRLDYAKVSPGVREAMLGLEAHTHRSGLEPKLLDLVKTRVSQINGCAFCLDMHTKDARAAGESEQRLHLLAAWREASQFSDRERAALAWAEAVTRVEQGFVPDPAWDEVRGQFSEKEIADLTLAIVAINGWNRLNVAFRTPAGNYEPAGRKR